EAVAAAQARFGKAQVAAAIEELLSDTATLLAARGVTRFICAGGETSGAIVEALAPAALQVGPEIDPGVPALFDPESACALTLKSGNFGAADFFAKAARALEGRG
ncbi:MAG: nucleotide-binding domain containing protein, partial [Pseudomonadota bacterium]